MAIDYPPVFINNYLERKDFFSFANYFDGAVKFFPTQPTTIDTLNRRISRSI
jgi:hypothetical protein